MSAARNRGGDIPSSEKVTGDMFLLHMGAPTELVAYRALSLHMIRKLYIGADPYKMLRKVDKTVYW